MDFATTTFSTAVLTSIEDGFGLASSSPDFQAIMSGIGYLLIFGIGLSFILFLMNKTSI